MRYSEEKYERQRYDDDQDDVRVEMMLDTLSSTVEMEKLDRTWSAKGSMATEKCARRQEDGSL